MLARSYICLDLYVKGLVDCNLYDNGTKEAKGCSTFLAGQLIKASNRLGCFPIRQTGSDRHDSIMHLYSELKGISFEPYVDKKLNHVLCCCRIPMVFGIGSTLTDAPSAVLDSHRVHLKEQWKKGNPDPGFT